LRIYYYATLREGLMSRALMLSIAAFAWASSLAHAADE